MNASKINEVIKKINAENTIKIMLVKNELLDINYQDEDGNTVIHAHLLGH